MSEQKPPYTSTSYSNDDHETTITSIPDRLPYHDYTIQELWARETQKLSAQGLLDIAAYVEANKARLETEAQGDYERNKRAMSADMADMHRIKQEWHDYRHTDAKGLGDETGPMVPLQSDQE